MTAVSTDQESQKTAKKPEHARGRKKGCEKSGGSGYYAPAAGLTTAQMRQFMRDKSKTVENLLRMADGKRIRLFGPTNKAYWIQTTPQMMTWAMGQVLTRILPTMGSITLAGDADGTPIRTQHLTDSPIGSDRELARRLRLALDMGDKAQPEPQDAPTNGMPLGHTNGVDGAQRTQEAPEPPSGPAVGKVTVIDKDRGIALRRLTADGRPDDGGDWQVVHGDKDLRVLRGITLLQARQVVEAMDDGGKFDG